MRCNGLEIRTRRRQGTGGISNPASCRCQRSAGEGSPGGPKADESLRPVRRRSLAGARRVDKPAARHDSVRAEFSPWHAGGHGQARRMTMVANARWTAALSLAVMIILSAGGMADEPAPAKQDPPANTPGEISVETREAMTAVIVPMTGSYAQHEEAMAKLTQYVGKTGLEPAGPPFGVYHNNPMEVPEDSLLWEVGMPVAAGPEDIPDPFVLKTYPETEAAVMNCTGPYEGSAACIIPMYMWIPANGYAPAGSIMEEWLSDPTETPPEKLQMRITIPVSKR
ncbi:MAG: hypothetical protein GF355_08910 [Candidatus Eisenbacteria bacterium]|nr:hypothetical protein [Candidatus Eisenbacteria bacterium]